MSNLKDSAIFFTENAQQVAQVYKMTLSGRIKYHTAQPISSMTVHVATGLWWGGKTFFYSSPV